MILKDKILAPLTTFHIGGPAQFFIEAHSLEDVHEAISYADQHQIPLYPLGGGSNVLVPDRGVSGVVLRVAMNGVASEPVEDKIRLIADAGTIWEEVVERATTEGLWGIENLAGIPGTIGGAAVQNIGAYGVELESVFEYADVIDRSTGQLRRVSRDEAMFGYRTSYFKKHKELILIRIALNLAKHGLPRITYPDLLRVSAAGESLTTPREITHAVCAIRGHKFPQKGKLGTAGSFFKNPIVPADVATALCERFQGLPMFPQSDGSVKISLAWILDHVLSLKGFSVGGAQLYTKHSLVVVAEEGATSGEVDSLACEIEKKVFETVGINIEREVETFGQ